MSSKEEREAAYQRAVIELARQMPLLIRTMENLTRAIHLMPNTVHVRP